MGKKKDKSGKLDKQTTKKEAPSSSQANMGKAAGANDSENGIWQDSRFQHLLTDPRFRGVPKVQRKVKIDKRFQGMFTDDKFKVKYTVDKYGRPVNKSNAEDLRKFYELDENESSSGEEPAKKESDLDSEAEAEQQERRAEERAIANLEKEESNDALESDSSEVSQSLRQRLTNPEIDYARGEGRLYTDSSSDEDSDDEDEGPELQIDHVWGELDNDAEHTEESTRRLAVCNMDWDRIRAEDLMVMLISVPKTGPGWRCWDPRCQTPGALFGAAVSSADSAGSCGAPDQGTGGPGRCPCPKHCRNGASRSWDSTPGCGNAPRAAPECRRSGPAQSRRSRYRHM